MRARLQQMICVAALVFAGDAEARMPATKLERVEFLGRDYVRLMDWARSNGFNFAWVKHGELARVNTGSHTLVFRADSRAAEVNGIKVWLSYPVAVRDANAYIALLDMQTSIEPIVFPRKNSLPISVVALDPGHGGKDKGYHKGSVEEKKYTLLLTRELRSQLERAGFSVVLTRDSDVSMALAARPAAARRRGAHLFVSLHFNSTSVGSDTVRGAEVYCLTPPGGRSTSARVGTADTHPGSRFNDESVLLAFCIQRALVREAGLEDRGVRRAQFEVLRTAAMPAVLVEAGFMSHPVEGKKLRDPAFRRELARAITSGLLGYKRTVESANYRDR